MDRYAAAHATANGPGDGRTTAAQVLQDENLQGKLVGKTILITGGNAGLGRETARILRQTGAKVYITTRTVAKGEEVAKAIAQQEPNSSYQDIGVIEMELTSLASVRRGAAAFLSQSPKLNILINNAGVMAIPEGRSEDGFELQFAINHLAHFLLFQLLKPALLASSTPQFQSRVVTVSSAGHRFSTIVPENYNLEGKYDPFIAYGQTKTANIFLSNEIERRFASQGVHAWSLHPGAIFETELARHQEGGADALMKNLSESDPGMLKIARNIPQGAATSVWAAIAHALEGKGGLYLEDVQVARPVPEGAELSVHGYGPHAYDKVAAERLWNDSLKLVGLPAES